MTLCYITKQFHCHFYQTISVIHKFCFITAFYISLSRSRRLSTMIRNCPRHFSSLRALNILATTVFLTLMGLFITQRNQCYNVSEADIHEIIQQRAGSLVDSKLQNGTYYANAETFHAAENDVTELSDRNPDFKRELAELGSVTDNDTSILNNNKHFFFSRQLLALNISKYDNNWFEVFSEEKYLQNNETVFKKSSEIKNSLNDSFIIDGENICKGSKPFLLVIIPSVVGSTLHRNTIRWTWLQAAETNTWPRAAVKETVKHIFLFGYSEGRRTEEYKDLHGESKIFKDVVMVDFIDSYRNLSRKILNGFRWAHRYCPQARFVLKADEDTFINVPQMIELLQHVSRHSDTDSFVIGLRHTYDQPPVVRDGRWAVSKDAYPLPFYPRYLYGHTYALSGKAVFQILDISQHVMLIPPEDAFITGILPKVGGVTRITAPSFTVCCRDIFDCEVVWNQRVALPELKSADRLVKLWTNVITHICNATTRFI